MNKIYYLIFFLFLLLGFSLAMFFLDGQQDIQFSSKSSFVPNYLNIQPESKEEIIVACSNLSLEQTAECLVNTVKTFYNYTLTDDGEVLDFEQLKTKGGDCRDYSLFYEDLGKSLGFYTRKFSIPLNTTVVPMTFHAFATISDDSGYCLIDQRTYTCIPLQNGK